ncbi:sigma-70 family RNA polymerase sigma factor [Halobacillus sp. BAB-2008]|uniref:sigma-70 family RNA polymerase sigma factor n=1 Tax=Halobacillus sp. BAB-2008 TaxID=1246484 RepID=UPI0002A50ADF|nr:sigma-70 family RNA polymerase sigma factor [Halobacillus sp. BAB-2008]ELK46668.1 RNA polymerase factor sigma C [Halobacillus sp. BAB-2008]
MIRKQHSKSSGQEAPVVDQALVEQWIQEYGHDLKWLAFSYVKDYSTAEDIVQETMIKAYQKYPTFKQESTTKTWLYKIAINLCKDYLKSSYVKRVIKRGTEMFRHLPSGRHTPEETLLKRSEEEALLEEVLKLDDKYREMIVLYYFEEFDVHEVAQVLRISPNTVKTRLRRARQILQDRLTEKGSLRHE